MDRSVTIAAITIKIDPRTTPHRSNASGSDKTPPPTMEAERLKVEENKFAFRLVDSNSGSSTSTALLVGGVAAAMIKTEAFRMHGTEYKPSRHRNCVFIFVCLGGPATENPELGILIHQHLFIGLSVPSSADDVPGFLIEKYLQVVVPRVRVPMKMNSHGSFLHRTTETLCQPDYSTSTCSCGNLKR